MEKIKEQYVLVTVYDRNRKPKYYICEDMETAKTNFPGDTSKRFITLIKK